MYSISTITFNSGIWSISVVDAYENSIDYKMRNFTVVDNKDLEVKEIFDKNITE